MVKRGNSFARALKQAEARLNRAKAERVAAQTRLLSLDLEIPRLERSIHALHGLVAPQDTPLEILKSEARPITERAGSPGLSLPPPNLGPEELAKWYADRDLSNVGSIVPNRPATTAPQSEDETLVDDFAIGKRE